MMRIKLRTSVIGWTFLPVLSFFVLGHLRAADPPKALSPVDKLVREWQLDGFKSLGGTFGDRLVTREFRSDKPLPELWNAYVTKVGSKERFKAGTIGGDTSRVGESKIDFRFHSTVNDDEDNANSRTGVQSATLCFDTDAGTVVIVLSRGKAESKTFISMVAVVK